MVPAPAAAPLRRPPPVARPRVAPLRVRRPRRTPAADGSRRRATGSARAAARPRPRQSRCPPPPSSGCGRAFRGRTAPSPSLPSWRKPKRFRCLRMARRFPRQHGAFHRSPRPPAEANRGRRRARSTRCRPRSTRSRRRALTFCSAPSRRARRRAKTSMRSGPPMASRPRARRGRRAEAGGSRPGGRRPGGPAARGTLRRAARLPPAEARPTRDPQVRRGRRHGLYALCRRLDRGQASARDGAGSARSPSCARISRTIPKHGKVDRGARHRVRSVAVAVSFLRSSGVKLERDAVHAVACAGRLRTIGKTWPRCASQVAQRTSVRRMNHERSSCSLTASLPTGAQKLGQPVPESNLVSEENSGAPQHMQLNMPGALFVVERIGEGALGAVLPGDMILFGSELLAPLLVGLGDFRAADRDPWSQHSAGCGARLRPASSRSTTAIDNSHLLTRA